MKSSLTLLLVPALFACCSTSNHYSSLTKEETARIVAENIERRDYEVDVDRAIPMGGRSINLTSSYSVRIKGDSVYSHLPYYGRAYSVPYGGGEGLNFSSTVAGYTVSSGEKGQTEVKFTTRSSDDNLEYTITLWPNGSATVNVLPGNRQSINYSGKVRIDR